jgi:PAS domain-containing protein
MAANDDEEKRLRAVALQNAKSIVLARQRAEDALRKQSDWLRVTLTNIGDAVISPNDEGRITFLNAVAEALTGWPQTEAQDRPLADFFVLVNKESRQPADNPALRSLRDGINVGLPAHQTEQLTKKTRKMAFQSVLDRKPQ